MNTIKYADFFTLVNGSESFEDELIQKTYNEYLDVRRELGRRVAVNIRKARMVEQGQGRIEAN